MYKIIVTIVFGFILAGFLGVQVTATDLITFTPDWIKRVEGYWYGQEISNKEYVTFVDYIIKNQIVSDYYLEILSNKYTDGIITYNNTAVSEDIVLIALNEWEKLNPDLVFVESSYSPYVFIKEIEGLPFAITLNSDQELVGHGEDKIYFPESLDPKKPKIIYLPAKQDNITTINEIIEEIELTLGQINDKGYVVPATYR